MPKLLTQGVSSEPETGRSLIGIVAGFKSERWPDFDRNGDRLQVGIRSRDTISAFSPAPAPRSTIHPAKLHAGVWDGKRGTVLWVSASSTTTPCET